LASSARLQKVHKNANTTGGSHPAVAPRQTSSASSVRQTKGRQWPQLNQLNSHETLVNPIASGAARMKARRPGIFRQHSNEHTAAMAARPKN
jgi:hypothetical protein